MITADDVFRAALLDVPGVSDVIGTGLSAFNGFAPSSAYPCAQYMRTSSANPHAMDAPDSVIDARYDLLFYANVRADAWRAADAAANALSGWRGVVTVGDDSADVYGMFMRDAAEIPVVSEDGQEVGDFAVRQQWRMWVKLN